MDKLPFEIVAEPASKTMRITVRGFWETATLASYDTEVTKAAERMYAGGCRREEILVLFDARDASTQTQDLIASFKERFAAPDRQPRRIATLLSSALFKRQVERIAVPNQQIFDDETDALTWLRGATP